MWYKRAGVQEKIIRKNIEKILRHLMFLKGHYQIQENDVQNKTETILNLLKQKYNDLDTLRPRENILEYDKFLLDFINNYLKEE